MVSSVVIRPHWARSIQSISSKSVPATSDRVRRKHRTKTKRDSVPPRCPSAPVAPLPATDPFNHCEKRELRPIASKVPPATNRSQSGRPPCRICSTWSCRLAHGCQSSRNFGPVWHRIPCSFVSEIRESKPSPQSSYSKSKDFRLPPPECTTPGRQQSTCALRKY